MASAWGIGVSYDRDSMLRHPSIPPPHTGRERAGVCELSPGLLGRLRGHTSAGADGYGEHHQAELVHQVVAEQGVDQRLAAADQDGAAVLRLQLRHTVQDLALRRRRVGPGRFGQPSPEDGLDGDCSPAAAARVSSDLCSSSCLTSAAGTLASRPVR